MGSMIKTVMTLRISILQVALGLEVQKYLYEYQVTASYNDVRGFRISAGFSAGQSQLLKFKSE